MLSLEKICCFVPEQRKDLAQVVAEHNALCCAEDQVKNSDRFLLKNVFGLRQIAVAPERDLFALLNASVAQIVPAQAADKRRIRYILHCHSAPNIAPAGVDLLGRLKALHGLDHAISVGLGQEQCATPLLALSLCQALLAHEAEDAQILLLMGEIGFHPSLSFIPGVSILGDASAACLISRQGADNHLLALAQKKFRVADSVCSPTNIAPVAATDYGDDLIAVVGAALQQAAVAPADIALLLPHNINSISWKFFARNFPFALERIFLDNIASIGHCFTADPFINYCHAVAGGRLKKGDRFLMVSAGRCATFAAAVLEC